MYLPMYRWDAERRAERGRRESGEAGELSVSDLIEQCKRTVPAGANRAQRRPQIPVRPVRTCTADIIVHVSGACCTVHR